MRKLLALTLLLMLTAVHFHAAAPVQAQATGTITQVLRNDPNYSVFIGAAEASGLADDLDAPHRSYTVFAPPNNAMLTLLDNLAMSQAQLFSDRPLVRQIVQYHILGGETTASDISQFVVPQSIFTFSNQAMVIGFDGENRRIILNNGQATVVRPNTEVRNGIIHYIDGVLIPPGVEINVPVTGTTAGGAAAPAIPANSIPDIANRIGATSFVRAITAAGLLEDLANTPNLTVFVPRNGAFDTLQNSTGLTPEAAPASVLTFHVSPHALNQFQLASIATDSSGATLNGVPLGGSGSLTGTINTLNGTPLRLALGSGSILLNNNQALVTRPDIGASNGIIHVIDNVLIP
ncbi:MAG: fasciclin domain-containing protein [Chloroflexota bacterium]